MVDKRLVLSRVLGNFSSLNAKQYKYQDHSRPEKILTFLLDSCVDFYDAEFVLVDCSFNQTILTLDDSLKSVALRFYAHLYILYYSNERARELEERIIAIIESALNDSNTEILISGLFVLKSMFKIIESNTSLKLLNKLKISSSYLINTLINQSHNVMFSYYTYIIDIFLQVATLATDILLIILSSESHALRGIKFEIQNTPVFIQILSNSNKINRNFNSERQELSILRFLSKVASTPGKILLQFESSEKLVCFFSSF